MTNQEFQKDYSRMITKIRRPHIFTNTISKIILKRQGKKDGKIGIPSDQNNPHWICPMILKEHTKIDECMASVSYDIDKKCGYIYTETETLISDFYQKAYEAKKLHKFIIKNRITYENILENNPNLTPELSKMLNSKRTNEDNLDSMGIRLRRYNEYYNKRLKDTENKYLLKIKELKNDYQRITKNYQAICSLESELDIFFLEFCSKIEKRTAWYWQGVLIKHPLRKTMPNTPPQANNNFYIIHQKKRDILKDKIDKIELLHKEILDLEHIK